jgi:hypothetical protein
MKLMINGMVRKRTVMKGYETTEWGSIQIQKSLRNECFTSRVAKKEGKKKENPPWLSVRKRGTPAGETNADFCG